MSRKKVSLRQELPLLVWLVFLWCALWKDFSLGNFLGGCVLAFLVMRVFYLPPILWSGRFNFWYAGKLFVRFLFDLFVSSFQVAFYVVRVFWGVPVSNAIVKVTLRSRSDVLLTATVHCISLIPGSLVLEVDRSNSTLYLHALNIVDNDSIRKVREQVLRTEASFIKMMGTEKELAMLVEDVDSLFVGEEL